MGPSPRLAVSGKRISITATQLSGEARVGLSYIALPLLLGFQPAENMTILFGPEAGYLTDAKSKIDNQDNNLSTIYRKFDLGLDLGLIYMLNKRLGLDLRYNYGFNDLLHVVYTDPAGNITGQRKAGANCVLQIGLSVSLE